MDIQALHTAIAVVCPIDGVAVVDQANKATWRIDFKAEATPEQRAAARAAVEAFDANAVPVVEKPRDLAAELDALKATLIRKGTVTEADVAVEATANPRSTA